jgi:hypothetical protein
VRPDRCVRWRHCPSFEVLDRFQEWELDEDNCEFGSLVGIRGWEKLPVSVA